MCTSFLFSLDFHGFISIYMVLFLLTENLFLSWVYLWLFVFFILTSSTVLISQFAHGVYRSVCQWHAEIVCTYQSLPMLLMLPKLSPSQTFCCAPKLACVVTACVSQSAQSEITFFCFYEQKLLMVFLGRFYLNHFVVHLCRPPKNCYCVCMQTFQMTHMTWTLSSLPFITCTYT